MQNTAYPIPTRDRDRAISSKTSGISLLNLGELLETVLPKHEVQMQHSNVSHVQKNHDKPLWCEFKLT